MCGFTIYKDQVFGSIAHRGIEEYNDQFGDWKVKFHSLPLSSNEQGITQPLIFPTGIIVFNGEIFNYKQLSPNCLSDVHYLEEVFLNANFDFNRLFEESQKWDGFWSIAYITKKNKLYFFTDWLGKKQIYSSRNGISSEIKPIYNQPDFGHGTLDYSETKFNSDFTNFKNVYRCIPGVLYFQDMFANRAFPINHPGYKRNPKHNNLYDLIDEGVKLRLENRIDGVSLFLSGGLDSNIILHHALKYTNNLEIITIENQESEIVKQVLDYYGLEGKFISDDYSPMDLNDAVYHYEFSLDYGSLIPNWLLFKNATNSMVLTGDGSDELFGGYTRASERDTWYYDVHQELPYYHNVRLDRMSMAHTIEARSPLMSMELTHFARQLPWEQRQNKKILRDLYSDKLPKPVLDAKKKPLRLHNDKEMSKQLVQETFFNIFH